MELITEQELLHIRGGYWFYTDNGWVWIPDEESNESNNTEYADSIKYVLI